MKSLFFILILSLLVVCYSQIYPSWHVTIHEFVSSVTSVILSKTIKRPIHKHIGKIFTAVAVGEFVGTQIIVMEGASVGKGVHVVGGGIAGAPGVGVSHTTITHTTHPDEAGGTAKRRPRRPRKTCLGQAGN